MTWNILGLCSRENGHEDMYKALTFALSDYKTKKLSWKKLIHDAENQGLASLIYKHLKTLGFTLPENYNRLLRSLYLRNRRSNQIRNTLITEILERYHLEKIDTLLVKGIALSNFAYRSPESRPMRDIDLLVKKEDLAKAQQILLDLGYQIESSHHIPPDYYHLAPLIKTVEGLPVSIELHHNLLPLNQQYPLWPLIKSYSTARIIDIDNYRARTLNLEESLWYIYLHGFQMPLTYEAFRLVHIADIVSLVENYFTSIDWERVCTECPLLLNILSRFHFVTPWQDHIVNGLNLDIDHVPGNPAAPYRGWPQRQLKHIKINELPSMVKETLLPPQWWVQVYYGHLNGFKYLKVRFFEHPRTIWRWFKTYCRSYIGNRPD